MTTGFKILRKREDIRHLLKLLRHTGELPYALPFIGCLTTTLRGHYLYEAVIDKWPDFSTLILRQNQVEKQELNVHEYYLYGKDEKKIETLLDTDRVIDWKRPFILKLCRWEHRNMLLQCGEKHGGRFEVPPEAPLHIYTYPSLDEIGHIPRVPVGFRLGTLGVQHAGLVNSFWSYGGDKRSEEQIRFHIKHLPTTCAIEEETGSIAGWTLSHRDGSCGVAFLYPQYRNTGLALPMSLDIFEKVQHLGSPLFGYIANQKIQMAKLSEKLKGIKHFNDITFLKFLV